MSRNVIEKRRADWIQFANAFLVTRGSKPRSISQNGINWREEITARRVNIPPEIGSTGFVYLKEAKHSSVEPRPRDSVLETTCCPAR
jgi:hypothetical protein